MRALTLLLVLTACSSTTTTGGTNTADSGTQRSQCSAAREQLIPSVAKVATAEVKVISTQGGVTTIYVDASAGGVNLARANPHVYITMAGERVDVSDTDALQSTAWDLALKRTLVFTNSGDGGKGNGGGVLVDKAFDAVTAADLDAVTISPEAFFDQDCQPKRDQIGAAVTSFTGWYDYDQATNIPTPNARLSFAVKSAAGERYVVGIASFQAKSDGSEGTATGFYLLKVKKL